GGFTYDDAARLAQLTQPRGTTRFTYSPQTGRLATATAPGGEKLEYAYDGALPVSTTVSGSVAGSVAYTYDANLRVATETVDGANGAAFEYDEDGLLTKAGAMTIARGAEDGLIGALTIGGNTTTTTRSAFGEPESVVDKQGSSTVYGETYTRDNTGRITGKTETRGGTTTTWVYGYDSADRLATVTKNGSVVATYSYDGNGNRQVTRSGELPQPVVYDDRDRIAGVGGFAYAYTAAGELLSKQDAAGTTTYDYDALGALTKVTLPDATLIEYAVDAAGRRVAVKRDGAMVRGFLYGRGLGPVAELGPDGTVRSRFVYATHSNVPDYMVRDGKTYRIVTDQVGSPRAVVDTSNGAVAQAIDYDEFGRVVSDSNPGFQPFGFGGGLYDQDTKLVRFGARDYDPETGRFTAPDPLRFGGGGTNLYGYALADPVNLGDPTGQFLDTLLDIGFIAYDLFDMGRSLLNGCGVSGWQAAALGADVLGAVVPFATGGGAVVRAAAHERQITEGIYEVVTKEGLPYVGQSGNIEQRLAQHVRSGKITQEAADAAARTEVMGGKTAREIAEQRRINEVTNGVGASDPGIANKVNPIGPKRQHLLGD
ncbi:MAG TPA: RHS repeat-associated core domain-containing protein, partial [Solirubrobacter sp.]|nr:RHS repeat-associated core domain-containing protein [Solirubrobacter sp.]